MAHSIAKINVCHKNITRFVRSEDILGTIPVCLTHKFLNASHRKRRIIVCMEHIEKGAQVLWPEDDLKQVLGRNVRAYRLQRRMKQTDLGTGAGYSGHTQISNIETGKMLPSLPHLIAISAYLQKSIDALLRHEPEPPALSDDIVYMLNQFPLEMREQIRGLLLMTHQWHVRSRGDDLLSLF